MRNLFLYISILFLFSCNSTKEKELELKEKELELKERQLKLDSLKHASSKESNPNTNKQLAVTPKVKADINIGVKNLKYPKGNLMDGYSYEFKCDGDVWGKCQVLIKNNSGVLQRHFINNTNGLIKDIKLIDNKYFYFYSEMAGGMSGNYNYYHFLINIENGDIYMKDLECTEMNRKSCQLKDPLSIMMSKYGYIESEHIF